MKRQKLDEFEQQVLESCKMQMKIHIETLLERGIRTANIQIEIESYLRRLLKQD